MRRRVTAPASPGPVSRPPYRVLPAWRAGEYPSVQGSREGTTLAKIRKLVQRADSPGASDHPGPSARVPITRHCRDDGRMGKSRARAQVRVGVPGAELRAKQVTRRVWLPYADKLQAGRLGTISHPMERRDRAGAHSMWRREWRLLPCPSTRQEVLSAIKNSMRRCFRPFGTGTCAIMLSRGL